MLDDAVVQRIAGPRCGPAATSPRSSSRTGGRSSAIFDDGKVEKLTSAATGARASGWSSATPPGFAHTADLSRRAWRRGRRRRRPPAPVAAGHVEVAG